MPWYFILILIIFGLHLVGMIIIACNEKDIEKDYNTFGHVLWILFGIFIIPLIYLPCLLACLTHKKDFE